MIAVNTTTLSPIAPDDARTTGRAIDRERGQLDGFAALLAAINEVRRYMEALQEENRALQAAIDALRAGSGIAVVIDGKLFTLRPQPS